MVIAVVIYFLELVLVFLLEFLPFFFVFAFLLFLLLPEEALSDLSAESLVWCWLCGCCLFCLVWFLFFFIDKVLTGASHSLFFEFFLLLLLVQTTF